MPADTGLAWTQFKNQTVESQSLAADVPHALERIELRAAHMSAGGTYFQVSLREVGREISVYIQNRSGFLEIIGIERD